MIKFIHRGHIKIMNFNSHTRFLRITTLRHLLCHLNYNVHITYNTEPLGDDHVEYIDTRTHSPAIHYPRRLIFFVSPMSTALSLLNFRKAVHIGHAHSCRSGTVPFLNNDSGQLTQRFSFCASFIQFISTCSFNQTPPLTTQLHVISHVHAKSPVTSRPCLPSVQHSTPPFHTPTPHSFTHHTCREWITPHSH